MKARVMASLDFKLIEFPTFATFLNYQGWEEEGKLFPPHRIETNNMEASLEMP